MCGKKAMVTNPILIFWRHKRKSISRRKKKNLPYGLSKLGKMNIKAI